MKGTESEENNLLENTTTISSIHLINTFSLKEELSVILLGQMMKVYLFVAEISSPGTNAASLGL